MLSSFSVSNDRTNKMTDHQVSFCPHCNAQVFTGIHHCNGCGFPVMGENINYDESETLNPSAPSFNPSPFKNNVSNGTNPPNNENHTNNNGWVCNGCNMLVTHDECALGDWICIGCRIVLDRNSTGSSTSSDSPPFGPLSTPFSTPPRNKVQTMSNASGLGTLHVSHAHSLFQMNDAPSFNHFSLGPDPLQSSVNANGHNVSSFNNRPTDQADLSWSVMNQKAVSVASALGLPSSKQSVDLVKSIFRLQQEAKQRIDKENPPSMVSSMRIESNLHGAHGMRSLSLSPPTNAHNHQPKVKRQSRAKHTQAVKEVQSSSISNKESQSTVNLIDGQEPHRNLYVANFDENMTEEQVEDLFSAYCEVRRVVMKDVVDRATGDVKGHYCFVWTGSVEQAIRARSALHNAKGGSGGKKLQVKFAREGSFKITSMTITTDALGNANRKVVTLRSDVNNNNNNNHNGNHHSDNDDDDDNNNNNNGDNNNGDNVGTGEECMSPLNFEKPIMSFLDDE